LERSLDVNSIRHCTYCTIDSPLGEMLLVADAAELAGVYFSGQKYHPTIGQGWREDAHVPVLCAAKAELGEYFAGAREAFDLPLATRGTSFQREVWRAIATIPWGDVATYTDIATRAGRPGSARAAGAATGRNPWSIVVPCHRVVGADGTLTGYAGGLDRKRALLALEQDAARFTLAA
jgi:methylated-DNA-[protein]-cysteine S-methyltransferase